MRYLTLDYIHAHSRIDSTDEDTLLTAYAEAAEEATMLACNTTYEEMIEEYTEIPKAIIVATLMLVECLYVNRAPTSSVNMSAVPYTYDFMIKPYMKLCYPTDDETTETETTEEEES